MLNLGIITSLVVFTSLYRISCVYILISNIYLYKCRNEKRYDITPSSIDTLKKSKNLKFYKYFGGIYKISVSYRPRKSVTEDGVSAFLTKRRCVWVSSIATLEEVSRYSRSQRRPKATKTQTHRVPLFFSEKVSVARIFSVQYLSVSYIARGCPFHIRIGESSQNSKYTITSDTSFIAAAFILGLSIILRCVRFMDYISFIHKTMCYILHWHFTSDFVQRNKIKIVVEQKLLL